MTQPLPAFGLKEGNPDGPPRHPARAAGPGRPPGTDRLEPKAEMQVSVELILDGAAARIAAAT